MRFDRSALSDASRAWLGTFATACVLVVVGFFATDTSYGLMVGSTSGVLPNTSVNPADCNSTPGCGTWTQGDPGWNQVVKFANGPSSFQFNGIYLGDGWILTASHVGIPSSVTFNSGATYNVIPNVPNLENGTQHQYQIPNPTWNDPNLTQTLSDLQIFRIAGDPGISGATLATQSMTQNTQVVYIGWGQLRATNQNFYSVNQSVNPWQWSQVASCSGSGCFHGFVTNGIGESWGTNRIVSSDIVLGENDGNLQTVIDHGTIAYLTTYDQPSSDPFEAIAVGGDSGTPVFVNRNQNMPTSTPQWELAGITNAKYTFPGQDQIDPFNTYGIVGDADGFADIATYKSQILAMMAARKDYSLIGDLTLDGVAGGADDIAAFVAGWHYNNGLGQGTITSWMHGDLNHDGKVDMSDFLLMRSGLNAGAGAQLTSLMGGLITGAIPEPSTIALVVVPAFFAVGGRRRSRKTSL